MISTHLVAPEEIMAFLDGELATVEAQSIYAHLDTCAECAALARDLRGVSQSLASWAVPPMPDKLENSIMEVALVTGIRNRSTKAVRVLRPRSRRWKLWLIGGGAAFAALAMYTLFVPRFNKTNPHVYGYMGNSAYSNGRKSEQLVESAKADRFSGGILEQLGKGPDVKQSESKQFDRLDRAAKLMAPPSANFAIASLVPGLADQVALQPAPMIARTANLTVIVKDIGASRIALDAILTRHQGYPAQMNVSTPQGGRNEIEASLRIPAADLMATLADLKTLGRVVNESQAGEEVTQQHQDLEARLKTARETETRYQAILQQRTGTVADVLQVQQSIAEVRGNIEQMEAEQKNLEHRVNFASVELNLTEEYQASLASPGDSTSTQMHNAFVAGYRNATGTILGIILFVEEYGPAILIWLAILAVPVVVIRRRYRRVRSSL